MRSLKSAVGVLGALISIVYCGGLLFYFVVGAGELAMMQAVIGSESGFTGAKTMGLGPTMIGLGAIGLLFVTVFVIKILRATSRRNPPPLQSRGTSDANLDQGGESNADAVVARYLAKRSAEAPAPPLPTSPRSTAGLSAQPPSFGRRNR